MDKTEFEQFVRDYGKDILRFCQMTARSKESGNELYQDTMLKLLEKLKKLDSRQNVKSYAISISILLWKNKKKKYSVRNRIAPICSFDDVSEYEDGPESNQKTPENSPEQIVISRDEQEIVRSLVENLPEKYRLPLYLSYSADMKIKEISEFLHIPDGTVKTRIYKAKQILKKQLEAIGYDR